MIKTQEEEINHWSKLEKLSFRFFAIYFTLIILLHYNGTFPIVSTIMDIPTDWYNQLVISITANLFDIEDFITKSTGSSDRVIDYVSVLCILIFSVVGTFIWSLFSRKDTNYNALYYWLTVGLRYFVAIMFINYGLAKVIKVQFSDPSFHRLLDSFGMSSPMALAWTFLGHSKGYNIFMGIAEILAGLLFFRRTVVAGAIISVITATNVMAVNYFYDVPVKLLSSHLMIITLFILSKDLKQLLSFFFTNNSVKLSIIQRPHFKSKWIPRLLTIMKASLIFYVFVFGIHTVLKQQNEYNDYTNKTKNSGLYKISAFIKNGEVVPPKTNSNKCWKYLILENTEYATLYTTDHRKQSFKMKSDSITNNITLTSFQSPPDSIELTIFNNDPAFVIEAKTNQDSIKAYGEILQKEDFHLLNRGFHWINEHPYNLGH